jgi:MraZ protein
VAGLLPLRHFGPNFFSRGNLAFRGHYQHSLDAKNRLSIPARFRAAFASGVVLAKDPETCVAIWPPERHELILERALGDLNPMSKQYKAVSRYYQGNSFDLELDSAGRVTVPAKLLEYAGLEREVMVVGVGDHLEVWDQDAWDKHQSALDAEIEEVTEQLGHPS